MYWRSKNRRLKIIQARLNLSLYSEKTALYARVTSVLIKHFEGSLIRVKYITQCHEMVNGVVSVYLMDSEFRAIAQGPETYQFYVMAKDLDLGCLTYLVPMKNNG